jgi:hypothetical protein
MEDLARRVPLRQLAENFAVAVLGIAAVFDTFYLLTTPGRVALAVAYSIPILAGALTGIVIAAWEFRWTRDEIAATCAAALMACLANTAGVLAVSGMLHTGPGDWLHGAVTVLLSGLTPVLGGVAWSFLQRLPSDSPDDVTTTGPRELLLR